MKRFYTSYYAVCKESKVVLPDGSFGPTFSVSTKAPWFWKPQTHFPLLAPDETFVKAYKQGRIDERQYTRFYIDLLNSKTTPEEVVERLPNNAVLLCYEKTGDFCHRHLAGWWITKHTGTVVTELEVQLKTKKAHKPMSVDGLLDF